MENDQKVESTYSSDFDNRGSKVIIIPDLGDRVKSTEWATRKWKQYGLETIIYSAGWYNKESFSEKLAELLKKIDLLARNGGKVSVIGCSAGASLALNAFIERRNVLDKAVSVCGRLRTGNQNGFRSLETRSRRSKSFAESVKIFESKESMLGMGDRKNIMTVSALFDELVPISTSTINGATNIRVPMFEHSFAIYGALSIFSGPIISFLKN